jgi:putative endonuclease
MQTNQYYVYILTSKKNGPLYTGVTGDLMKRVYEHKHGLGGSFTGRYKINKLVYYEDTTDIESAIIREKQIKGGSRQKKIDLIDAMNPDWEDLYYKIIK